VSAKEQTGIESHPWLRGFGVDGLSEENDKIVFHMRSEARWIQMTMAGRVDENLRD